MVKNGVDRIDAYHGVFRGKRLGLITSQSGTTADAVTSLCWLHQNHQLTALFSPEHGMKGDAGAGEHVDTYVDADTGVTVYSLYGKGADSRRLTPHMLSQVDAVVYDIQDIGSRYYTYISTLLYAMQECARHGKELIVLDRINPLGGRVEGNLLPEKYFSFVGAWALCVRYGLTIGELARMMNDCDQIGCDLTVIPCEGWHHGMLFPQTGKAWAPPSPNIRRFEAALAYPGTCLFEGTNLSEGRGTAYPFETIGAPYINGARLAAELEQRGLPAAAFEAVGFTPDMSKHRGVACQGVRVHITDAAQYRAVSVGLHLLDAVRRLYPADFAFLPPVREGHRSFIQLLSGDPLLERADIAPEDLLAAYENDSRDFAQRKQSYHLYD